MAERSLSGCPLSETLPTFRTTQTYQAYRAPLVVPVTAPVIVDGVVILCGDKIAAVMPFAEYSVGHDLGSLIVLENVALIPGLINAHTHLEFSDLSAPIGAREIEFTDWIRLVVSQRQQRAPGEKHNSIRAGLQESERAGVVGVGEIATFPFDPSVYENSPTEVTMFAELLGRNEQDVPQRLASLDMLVANCPDNVRLGVSPHAPYSVHPMLFKGIVDKACADSLPVAMHLAETKAERELIAYRRGPFCDLLKELGAWHESSFADDFTIPQYLKRFPPTSRGLVIHGNYLTTDELELIASRGNLTVVFCPRTHYFFGHQNYPLISMNSRGVPVAVGD